MLDADFSNLSIWTFFIFWSLGGGRGGRRIDAPFLVKECLERSNLDLAQHLVLSGGTTMMEGVFLFHFSYCVFIAMMEGFAERFSKEIKLRTARRTAVKIERNRTELAWIGGSVLSSFSSFKETKLVTREVFEEWGCRAVEEMMKL